jgi:hypothetical protein
MDSLQYINILIIDTYNANNKMKLAQILLL